MKSRMYRNWSIGLAVAVLPLVGGYAQESLNLSTNAAPASRPVPAVNASAPAPATPGAGLAAPAAEADVVDALAKPMSAAPSLPPNVRLSAPAAEVVRLAQSGVDESVMLAFITNSTSTFNLGAEEIIYLNDIGVPSVAVTAMIQHDQVLKELSANAAPAAAPPTPAPPAAYAPEPVPAPAPEEMAPPPDYATDYYPPPADDSYASFYDTLAPYGTWIDVAGYGPCWQPTVVVANPYWQPYCNGGRWLYTDCGWYWQSGYSWGWAPFHYGRWFRHSHYGWCWVPGNVWGPSWVSWRYNGNYCGWAPLPPAAGYHAGVGLTYQGQRVSTGFGFGLSAGSYTFVAAGHFSDRHLNRYALPHDQAGRVYNQTAPSTTIVGNSTRVINRGIPVARVEAATHTQIHPLTLREANASLARGARGERLDPASQTLAVYRPQIPQPTAAQAGFGGRAGSGSTVINSAPAGQRAAPVVAPRAGGGSPAIQPVSGGGSARRTDRSANQANAGGGEPMILHGADRSWASPARSSVSAGGNATPSSSLIIIGRKEGTQPEQAGSTAPWSRATISRQDSYTRSAGSPRNQPFMTADSEVQAPAQSSWSEPHAYAPTVRSEQPSQYTAPAYRAPAETPRSAPAQHYEQPRVQSYSPPAASYAPRVEPMVSQPVHSAPPAPAPSAPATQSQSSSGGNRR